jgi:hypothetical protein
VVREAGTMQIAMTEEQFQALAGKAKAQGIALEGREGVIEKMGVKAKWGFDGANLTVDVLEKPFFLSKEAVEEKLRAALG